MPETKEIPNRKFDGVQAVELAVLVDLEARWENLRNTPKRTAEPPSTTLDLHGMQKAYEAFHTKLEAYNKRYAPPHVPELLLNTAVRLGKWCQNVLKLYRGVENEPDANSPVHLMEKAYRWADRVADRMGKARFHRPPTPANIQAFIRDLEALNQWCDDLAAALCKTSIPPS